MDYGLNGNCTMSENSKFSPVSFRQWIITFLLMIIPIVNIVLLFLWAFKKDINPSKGNWAKASLVLFIPAFILPFIFVIILPTYLDYTKSSYASEARTVMSNINNASKMYYQTRGEWPSEIDELERAGQLDVSRSTKLKWTFDLQLSDQGGRITAISTEEMSGGAGHQVVYDADLGKFTGYGSP